jgi:hypothetical protein
MNAVHLDLIDPDRHSMVVPLSAGERPQPTSTPIHLRKHSQGLKCLRWRHVAQEGGRVVHEERGAGCGFEAGRALETLALDTSPRHLFAQDEHILPWKHAIGGDHGKLLVGGLCLQRKAHEGDTVLVSWRRPK